MASGEYTFYPKFSEFVTLYRGVVRVWIADGTSVNPGVAGKLYAEYIDGLVQELGYVSDYDTAKDYFEDLGIELTYPEWVAILAKTPENARRSEAWAVGKIAGTDVPNTDETYRNNSQWYAGRAKVWTDGSDLDGNSVQPQNNATFWANEAHGWTNNKEGDVHGYSQENNAKHWAEQAKSYSDGKGLTEQDIRPTDNAEYYKDQSKLWANNGVQGDIPGEDNNARYWAEQSKSYSDGKSLDDSTTLRGTDNAEYYKEEARKWVGSEGEHASATDNSIYWKDQAKLWANNGTDGESPSSNNNAKHYSEVAEENNNQAESWTKGTREGQPDTVRPNASTDNALYYSGQSKLWANYGSDGDIPTQSNNAKAYSEDSNEFERQSESWAKGTRDGQPDVIRSNAASDNSKAYSDLSRNWANFSKAGDTPTDTNNAKYYSDNADSQAQIAEENKLQAESWAVGTRGGEPDTERQGASTDNAKHYSEESDRFSQNSEESSLQSESWTKGTRDSQPDDVRPNASTDNAYYYMDQAKLWANNGTEGDLPDANNNAKEYARRARVAAEESETSAQHSASSDEHSTQKANEADASAQAAALSETHAATSEQNAYTYASNAAQSETNASSSEANSAASEAAAAQSENNAEAWAVGQRNGTDVSSEDPTYENNSYWYARRARISATDAAASDLSAQDARDRALLAVGKGAYISPTTFCWVTWDSSVSQWVDTGIDARGLIGPIGPQGEPGRDAISVEVENQSIAFEIDSNGHLILVYDDAAQPEPPNYYINEEGHLIYEF